MANPALPQPSPTPPPTSGVIQSSSGGSLQRTSFPMPATGFRRALAAWSPVLQQVCPDVAGYDDAQALAVHAQHAAAMQAATKVGVRPLTPTYSPLSPIEDAWVKNVTASPRFLTIFGPQGWQVARVALDKIVAWQPVVDAPRASAPALSTPEEVVQALLPEIGTKLDYNATVMRDERGDFHAVLAAQDPNHDLDIRIDDGGDGVHLRLRPRPNLVHATLINGRLVLLNGYNRLARLASEGHADAPILILQPGHPAGAVSDRPGFFPLAFIAQAPCPPLICDFVNPDLVIDFPFRPIVRAHDMAFTHTELPIRR